MNSPSLYDEEKLQKFVNKSLDGAELDLAAAKLLKTAGEGFVKSVIQRSVELKTTRRSTSRNKSIRSEDVYTALYDLPQFSFLSANALAGKRNLIDHEIQETAKKQCLEKGDVPAIINPLLLEEENSE